MHRPIFVSEVDRRWYGDETYPILRKTNHPKRDSNSYERGFRTQRSTSTFQYPLKRIVQSCEISRASVRSYDKPDPIPLKTEVQTSWDSKVLSFENRKAKSLK